MKNKKIPINTTLISKLSISCCLVGGLLMILGLIVSIFTGDWVDGECVSFGIIDMAIIIVGASIFLSGFISMVINILYDTWEDKF